MSMPVVSIWDNTIPGAQPHHPRASAWDTVWPLTGGTAWVFYSNPGQTRVRKPVILADGFSAGKSDPDALWNGLENGEYPFISKLKEAGFDLVLLGFDERSASITDNAAVAIQCIEKAIADREGTAELTVGGFSMGGLVTRYALAKMHHDGDEHETATYLSYDTPHNGAWLPISVQAFAHFVKDNWGNLPGFGELLSSFSRMVNSPAARQLLRWHIETVTAEARQDRARTDFLAELERVGSWPPGVRRLGVANGTGTGAGNNIPAGVTAMRTTGAELTGTRLDTQDTGEQVVAILKKTADPEIRITTSGLPDIDGAPGGLFPEALNLPGRPANFGTAAMLAGLLEGEQAELTYNATTFVPSVSAVAAGEIDDPDALYSKIDPADSELDHFMCSSENQGHTVITVELGEWILDKLQTP
ncbi:esterase/lipase family protein [Streptomyces sp. NPDC058049]|uniref:esterase/lipase family protein n=1 Tax=Streptomyces sp. NPDC058049 TaxID=3346314 RepID=UPI0036ECB99C